MAEQAAAAELLSALREEPVEELIRVDVPLTAAVGPEPRMVLNEMRQLGLITGYGYELVERRGPEHRPVFVVKGWVEGLSGERRFTAPVEAQSKRDAEALAAVAMKALAVEVSGS